MSRGIPFEEIVRWNGFDPEHAIVYPNYNLHVRSATYLVLLSSPALICLYLYRFMLFLSPFTMVFLFDPTWGIRSLAYFVLTQQVTSL